MFQHKSDVVGIFAHHKVACNLLMMMMILAGAWALERLNTQFFPNFALDFVSVAVEWTGAAAEDVETSIIDPLEQQLRTLDGLQEMTSTSAEGRAHMFLEYEEGTDMGVALDQVKEQVALLRNLPANAEEPEVSRAIRYEPIARLLITGPRDPRELRAIAQQMEQELLEIGVAKVTVTGVPQEEIAVQVPTAALHELDMSLDAIAERIARTSRDLPAGTIGRNDVSRQLRALEQRRREIDFEGLALLSDESGRLVTLGDVATIERRPRSREVLASHRGKPAVTMQLSRAESTDSLEAAALLKDWYDDARHRWPPGIEIRVYNQSWQLIRDRIMLLLKNGVSGLALVVAVLFFFLNGRVALWVAVGIPVSFLATLAILYAVGGSINMISLFGLIMALGIIVDDAIVVGEDALAHYQAGEGALESAEGGARRMFAPVLSSSLTTIAAFLPLMLVSGIIGNILFDIPLVVVCVIVASLVESFLILPGHLRHAFQRLSYREPSPIRLRLDRAFEKFREKVFRPVVTWSIDNAWTTLSLAITLLALSAGLVLGKRVPFNFFPTAEGSSITANVAFVAGTPPQRVESFVRHAEQALYDAEDSFGEHLVEVTLVRRGENAVDNGEPSSRGDQLGAIEVQLVEPDRRSVRNPELIRAWRENIRLPPGIESFSIVEQRAGPPGRDVDVRLIGGDAAALKEAALELVDTLKTVPGIIGVTDDMPFGQEQFIYRLTPEGRALGLTVESVGSQLRAAYDGRIAQIFQDGDDELEVRVVLPNEERYNLASLENFNVALPEGGTVPLLTAVTIDTRRGFDILRHKDGKLSVQVSADVDPAVNNNNEVNAALAATTLPALAAKYAIDFSLEGRQADQRQTLGDMAWGAMLALALIYLVLAWVFASYGWPLVVMATIPFGLTGALAGHWLLDIDLTILSLFGLFGLSGIVVNDSIIVVMFYKRLIESGLTTREAVIEAACQRLRAVLLTSLTTIGGLTPLMFETSMQAQFLIPMAVSISFGLGFATVLVLMVIPSLLCIHESAARRLGRGAGRAFGSVPHGVERGEHPAHP